MTLTNASMQAHGILIRRAELEDVETVLEAVCQLAKAATTSAHWSRKAFSAYLATDAANCALHTKAMFVACANPFADAMVTQGDKSVSPMHRIVGFAAFSAILMTGTGEASLENMVVSMLWRRHGIGRRLLAAGCLWCRAHASATLFLEVRRTNQAAIALYEDAGFSVVGNRPEYYREPEEDGLQMKKILGVVAEEG